MFDSLLERIARALDNRSIPYMVIGGQAVLLYGEPRLTRDIDVTLGVALDRLDDIVNVVADAGLEALVDPVEFTRTTMVLPCRDLGSELRVDFIFSFLPYEQQAIARSRMVAIGSTQVRFTSPEDLIIQKVIAGRPRDLEDVTNVLIKQRGVDRAYVRSWLARFAEALDQPFGAIFARLVREAEKTP